MSECGHDRHAAAVPADRCEVDAGRGMAGWVARTHFRHAAPTPCSGVARFAPRHLYDFSRTGRSTSTEVHAASRAGEGFFVIVKYGSACVSARRSPAPWQPASWPAHRASPQSEQFGATAGLALAVTISYPPFATRQSSRSRGTARPSRPTVIPVARPAAPALPRQGARQEARAAGPTLRGGGSTSTRER